MAAAKPETPAEVQEKAEHEEDPTNCEWPYSEHDESDAETVNGVWSCVCRRCGAEMSED